MSILNLNLIFKKLKTCKNGVLCSIEQTTNRIKKGIWNRENRGTDELAKCLIQKDKYQGWRLYKRLQIWQVAQEWDKD